MPNPIRDNRPNVEKQAENAEYRSGYQATSPSAGVDQAANNFLLGSPQQPQGGVLPEVPQQETPAMSNQEKAVMQMLQDMQTRASVQEDKMAMAMADPLAMVLARSEINEKEVSLDTLTKAQKDKILQSFIQGRDIAKEQYNSVIEPRVEERRKVYMADKEYYRKKFPQLSESSEFCSKDVQTACQWILPGLMEVFTGSEAPLSVKGVNVEDDDTAKKIQQLVQYQLEKKNDYHGFCLAVLRTALSENWAVAKAWWKREVERKPLKKLLDINDSSDVIAMTEAVGRHEIEVTKIEEDPLAPDLLTVYFDQIIVRANHPVIEFVPSSELRYTPDAPDIQDCKFVAHRKIVRGDYLKRRERDGIYKNVDKALKEYEGDIAPTSLERLNDPDRTDRHRRLDDGDLASKEVELYEAYLQVDYNNDGIYEKLIVHAIGDTLIRVATNEFEAPPFFICSAEYDPNAVFNRNSFSDSLMQLQDIKTALMRQIVVNVAKNNSPRIFVDEQRIDMDALLSGEEIIPVNGGDVGNHIFTPPSLPLSSVSMELLTQCQTEIEAQSGSTRYNQGLDSNSLNKMLALDTPIPMADGSWKKNGDIVAGDMVIGSDGKPTKVLVAHPAQDPERAFEIMFMNGDIIKCGTEHLWLVKVSDKNYHNKSPEWERLPTGRIFELFESGHHVMIPRVGRVQYPEQNLPMDPYIFGCWLGDGDAHTNRFTTADEEIRDAFEKWAKQFYGGHLKVCKQQHGGKAITYSVVNTPFRTMLKDLGCLKDGRYETTKNNVKHIPEIYLRGSYEQRLALLQGLMDTDGCIDRNGNAIFCNSEPALIEGVARLIESLGGKPNVHWTEADKVNHKIYGSNFRHVRPHCHITFAIRDCPVRLPRKVSRWRTRDKYWEMQSIVSIKEIPIESMRCLTVEADDRLYCCGRRFTVTSNTATGITSIMGASEKRNKLIARSMAEKFFIPIYKLCIRMDQKFLEDEQMVRLTNENFRIRREEMDIDYDLIVNVGQGAGSREQQIQYLMYTLQSIYPQLTQQGIVSSKSWYSLVVRLLETLGLRDVSSYLLDPESPEAKQLAQQAQQMAAQAQAQALQNSLQLSIAKTSVPRVSIDMSKMPPDVVREYLKQKFNIETTENNIHQHEEFLLNDE